MALPSLETARLELHPWQRHDIDALHSLWTDPGVRRWLWDDEIISREQAEAAVLESIRNADEHGVGMWCVRMRGQEELAGFCGFRFIEDTRSVELMFGFAPAYWGRGLATEASRAALVYAFAAGALPVVYGRTDAPNRASARLLERLGMRFDREILIRDRPILCYSLQDSAWRRTPGLSGTE